MRETNRLFSKILFLEPAFRKINGIYQIAKATLQDVMISKTMVRPGRCQCMSSSSGDFLERSFLLIALSDLCFWAMSCKAKIDAFFGLGCKMVQTRPWFA